MKGYSLVAFSDESLVYCGGESESGYEEAGFVFAFDVKTNRVSRIGKRPNTVTGEKTIKGGQLQWQKAVAILPNSVWVVGGNVQGTTSNFLMRLRINL
jgi:outer membrane protein assembly factor BamB